MVDPYAIVRRLTGHELISPKDARLRAGDQMNGRTVNCKLDACNCSIMDEAASTLQTLSARNAALEAENERFRDLLQEIEDSTDLTTVSCHLYDRVLAALTAPKGGQDHG